MAGVVQECLAQVVAGGGATCEIHVSAPPASPTAVRVTAPNLALAGVDAPSWLIRSRARAALSAAAGRRYRRSCQRCRGPLPRLMPA